MEPNRTTRDEDPGAGRRERRRRRSRRFLERYEQRRRMRLEQGEHFIVRPARIAVGSFLVVLSPFVGVIPGPGGMFVFLPGAFLLASEVRRAAIIMDRVENETIPRLRRLRARLRGGPKREWVEHDPVLWADYCEQRHLVMPEGADACPDAGASEDETAPPGRAPADVAGDSDGDARTA